MTLARASQNALDARGRFAACLYSQRSRGSQFVQMLNGIHISTMQQVTKANRELGMIKRSTVKVENTSTIDVEARIAYASQVWCTQTTTIVHGA